MEKFKVNTPISIQYLSLKRTTGLTDLTLKSYNAANTLVDTIVMTELANGVYKATFTPLVTGFFRIEISSVINKDFAAKEYDIVATDIEDVKTELDSVKSTVEDTKTELDATKAVVDTINTNVSAVEGAITAMQADVTDIDAKVTSIETKVDSIQADIDSLEIPTGGYIL